MTFTRVWDTGSRVGYVPGLGKYNIDKIHIRCPSLSYEKCIWKHNNLQIVIALIMTKNISEIAIGIYSRVLLNISGYSVFIIFLWYGE